MRARLLIFGYPLAIVLAVYLVHFAIGWGWTLLLLRLGIPVGIWFALSRWAWKVFSPVLDMMQTLPSFVYLIPALPFFGLGAVSAGIAEALVETALGLVVAIPAVWIYNYFTTRLEYFNVEMDNSSSELVDYFIKKTA